MKKSQLVDALTRIPGDPEIRLALRIGDDFDESALCTIAGELDEVVTRWWAEVPAECKK